MRFVTFLRGMNVGGNKKVPMAELKACLEKAGYENVKTLLNSGNVAFDAGKVTHDELESVLEKAFGFSIGLTTRTQDELKKIVDSDPFKFIKDAKQFYVTFVKSNFSTEKKLDFSVKLENSKFVGEIDGAVLWYVKDSAPQGATLDAMTYLDKTIGKDITTRNWNTVVKSVNL